MTELVDVHPQMRRLLVAVRRRAGVEAWQERLAVAERPRDHAWARRAACRGATATMFPVDPGGRRPRDDIDPDAPYPALAAAIAVCQTCPVRLDCLGDARHVEQSSLDSVHGVRGGLTPEQRADVYRTLRPVLELDDPDHDQSECDSNAAYHRHRERGQDPCPVSRAAHSRYKSELRRRRRAKNPTDTRLQPPSSMPRVAL